MSHILVFFCCFVRQKEGGDNVHLIFSKPFLKNLSQGSRISLIRQFRYLTQDDVSDMLGLEGESKRRTKTRYERGNRNPSKNRLKELSKILLIDSSLIEKYDEIMEYSSKFIDVIAINTHEANIEQVRSQVKKLVRK